MKSKIITGILCLACLIPISFGEITPDIYYDSNISAYGLKDAKGNILTEIHYDGISEFSQGLAITQKQGKFGVITLEGIELIPPTYKYITAFKNGYATVYENNSAGILNRKGLLVVPFDYKDISFVRGGYAIANKDNKYGLISTDNKVIHPFVWDELHMLDFTADFKTFVFKQNGLYGVASFNGEILLHPQHKELFHISDKEVAYVSNNKIGVMNHNQDILIPASYDSIYIAGNSYVGKSDDKYYFINLKKGTLSTGYDSVDDLSENHYLVSIDDKLGIYDAITNKEIVEVTYDDIRLLQNPHATDKYYYELTRRSTIHDEVLYRGVSSLDGREILPALYTRLGFINDQLIAYYDPQQTVGIYNLQTGLNSGLKYESIRFDITGNFGVITTHNDNYGLLGANGEFLIPADTDYIYESGHFYIAEKNEKKALFSKDTSRLTPFKYDTIYSFQNIGETEAAIVSIANRWGLLKPNGSYLVNPEYDAINEFVNGYAIVVKDNKYGFINTAGQVIIAPQFEDVSSFKNGLAIAKKDNLYGFIAPSGQFKISPVYDNVKPFNEEGRAVVTYKDRKGILNRDGTYFLKPIYKNLTFVADRLIVVQDSATKKYALLKANGEEISKHIYDDVGSFFKEETTYVEINGKYALLNNQGEILTQFIFDDMTLFNKGFANIMIGNKRGFINSKGDYILE